MSRTDVFGFLRGILVTVQAVVAAIVVGFTVTFLLAMVLPLPTEGLLFELLIFAIFLPAFYMVTYMALARAAQRGLRDFLAMLAGMTACNLVGEILGMAGVFNFMVVDAPPPVIPLGLVMLFMYVVFGGVAYAAFASARYTETQAS